VLTAHVVKLLHVHFVGVEPLRWLAT